MSSKIKPGYEYLDNGWRRKGDRYETHCLASTTSAGHRQLFLPVPGSDS